MKRVRARRVALRLMQNKYFWAVSTLHDMGPKALPALETALRDGDEATRAIVAECLEAMRAR